MTTGNKTEMGLQPVPPLAPEDEARLRTELQRFSRDATLLAGMRELLLREHDGQWAAMYEGRLFHAVELDELIDVLRRNDLDPARTPIRFVTSAPPVHYHVQ